VYVAALWALDFLPEISKIGAVRHNFHGGAVGVVGGPGYAAILFESADPHSKIQIRPVYYGLLAFSTLVSNHSRWVHSTITCNPPPSEDPGATTCPNGAAHANVDEQGRLKIVVISKELRECSPSEEAAAGCNSTFRVRVAGPSRYQHAAAMLSLHPGVEAGQSRRGITWAGQTFDKSVDGKPVGVRTVETVQGKLDGTDGSLVFEVRAQPLASASGAGTALALSLIEPFGSGDTAAALGGTTHDRSYRCASRSDTQSVI
jgi:hypothetical protein